MGLNGRQVPQWTREQLSTVEGQLEAQREILESIQLVNDTASSKRAALLKSAFEWACEAVNAARREEADEQALSVSARAHAGDDEEHEVIPPMIEGHA